MRSAQGEGRHVLALGSRPNFWGGALGPLGPLVFCEKHLQHEGGLSLQSRFGFLAESKRTSPWSNAVGIPSKGLLIQNIPVYKASPCFEGTPFWKAAFLFDHQKEATHCASSSRRLCRTVVLLLSTRESPVFLRITNVNSSLNPLVGDKLGPILLIN